MEGRTGTPRIGLAGITAAVCVVLTLLSLFYILAAGPVWWFGRESQQAINVWHLAYDPFCRLLWRISPDLHNMFLNYVGAFDP
jgi:hypothetical protein